MVDRIRRRSFLARGAQLAGLLALPASWRAAADTRSTAPAGLAMERIGEGISVVAGAGCNVTVIDTPDGVALVDGGLAGHAGPLLDFIRRETGDRPVQLLFNTHWHPEQTGANVLLGTAGCGIVAHENTRLWLGAEVDLSWRNLRCEPLAAVGRPGETFYTSLRKELGTVAMECTVLPQAHTDGDICIHLPQANVLVAGDLVAVGSYPVLDYCTGGWICGMLDATRALLDLCDANTRIVPGNGPVQTRAHLQSQLDMLTVMAERLIDLLRKGMSAEDMLAAAPSGEFDAQWGDPELFITNAYPGLWGHVRDLPARGYSGVV